MQRLKKKEAARAKIVVNLEDISLLALKFHPLDHVAEDKSKFGLIVYTNASPYEPVKFFIQSSIKRMSLRNSDAVKNAIGTWNKLVFHDNILELKQNFCWRTVMNKKTIESVWKISNNHKRKLYENDKWCKVSLARFVLQYAKNKVFCIKAFFLSPNSWKLNCNVLNYDVCIYICRDDKTSTSGDYSCNTDFIELMFKLACCEKNHHRQII